jgi:inhibitor of cysteine peptidase
VRQVDASANGEQVTVQVDETLQLLLPETPTTGYRWRVISNGEPVTELVEDRFQLPAEGAGQPGRHLWVFRVRQPGHASIALHQTRAWEPAPTPIETFTLDVTAE